MKSVLSGLSMAIVALAVLPNSASAADLTVAFADPTWTGDRIPEGQHCKKFGGIVYLASAGAAFVTGAALAMDGGSSAGH